MFISPMLLEKVAEPFDSDEYITEMKFDGIRLLLSYFDGKYRLYTRHNNEVTSQFDEIYKSLNLPSGTVLDGELIVPGEGGKPNFEAIMERLQSKNSHNHIQYCVFDILFYKGKNVQALPLIERKALLSQIAFDKEKIVPVPWIEGNGIKYFNLIKEMDLEGIVLKKKNSMYYSSKRSKDWLKVINYKYIDCKISGILKDKKSFILTAIDDNSFLGIMEFMPLQQRNEVYRRIEIEGVNEDEKVIWLNQNIPCNVKYRNWTSKGKLRIPSFNQWIS